MMMKTILALVDFSDVTPKIVTQAQMLAQAFHSRVILLHGLPKDPRVIDLGLVSPIVYVKPNEESVEAGFAKLQKLAEPMTTSGIKVSMVELRGATVEHIVAVAQKHEADLIIVGTHHHNAFYNLIIGSITDEVLKRASCPVLVVPNN